MPRKKQVESTTEANNTPQFDFSHTIELPTIEKGASNPMYDAYLSQANVKLAKGRSHDIDIEALKVANTNGKKPKDSSVIHALRRIIRDNKLELSVAKRKGKPYITHT